MVVTRKNTLDMGDIMSFTIKDIVRMSTQKVNDIPEYFGDILKRLRETSIERIGRNETGTNR